MVKLLFADTQPINYIPRDGTNRPKTLEIRTYYMDAERNKRPETRDMPLVYASDVEGFNDNDLLIGSLADEYSVVTFNLPGSGFTTGPLTVDEYYNALAMTLIHVANKRDVTPKAVGQGFGAYALAQLLGESPERHRGRPLVTRAVLLSPPISPTESFSRTQAWYHRNLPHIPFVRDFARQRGVYLFERNFDWQNARAFALSLFASPPCEKPLHVEEESMVILPGRTYNERPVRDIRTVAEYWQGLGARVEIFPRLNHWFAYRGSREQFYTGAIERDPRNPDEKSVDEVVKEFLRASKTEAAYHQCAQEPVLAH